MDRQAIFDQTAEFLLKQGKPAATYTKREEGGYNVGCSLRTKDGCKCAIGCHIPDDKYDHRFENITIDYTDGSVDTSLKREEVLKEYRALLAELFQPQSKDDWIFLGRLQFCHDEAAHEYAKRQTVRAWRRLYGDNMRRLAEVTQLDTTKLKALLAA